MAVLQPQSSALMPVQVLVEEKELTVADSD